MYAPCLTVLTRIEAIRVSIGAAAVHELLALPFHWVKVPLDERAITVARVFVVVTNVLKSGQSGRNVRALFVLLSYRYGEARLRQAKITVCRIVGDGRVAQSFTAFFVHKSIVVRTATRVSELPTYASFVIEIIPRIFAQTGTWRNWQNTDLPCGSSTTTILAFFNRYEIVFVAIAVRVKKGFTAIQELVEVVSRLGSGRLVWRTLTWQQWLLTRIVVFGVIAGALARFASLKTVLVTQASTATSESGN